MSRRGATNQPVRIIFLNRYYAPDHSATSQMLTDLAVSLAKVGEEVHVITSRLLYDGTSAALPATEVLEGVAIHRTWTSAFGRRHLIGRAVDYLSYYAVSAGFLLSIARRGDTFIAMTDPPLLSIPVALIARIRGARHINWLQDVFPEVAGGLGHSIARGPIGQVLRSLRNWSLRRACRNVVLGFLMREYLSGQGVDPASMEVIPNWADGVAVRPIEPRLNDLRTDWALSDKFVVGYSGNMGRAHEFQTIVDAAQMLNNDRDVVFLFIGSGPQRELVEHAVRERGLANLMFKPYQPREGLDRSLGTADVHLVSLRPELEGFIVPSKFYGIAAAGRPTIFVGNSKGEIGIEVRTAECGVCIEQGDAKSLALAIRDLRDDGAKRETMGRNARALFEQRYDKAIAFKKWRGLISDTAASSIP
jgi:glycosyltransferase involved in cell wall biosynthesis